MIKFLFAVGNNQYLERDGILYEAPRDAQHDPDGCPYGMLPHRGLSSTRDELIAEVAHWGGHYIEGFHADPEVLEEIRLYERLKVERSEQLRLEQKRRVEEMERKQDEWKKKDELDEPILTDDYPVFAGYWYLIDGVAKISLVSGTVATLKKMGACEVRRCDAVKRGLPLC